MIMIYNDINVIFSLMIIDVITVIVIGVIYTMIINANDRVNGISDKDYCHYRNHCGINYLY